LPFEAFREGGRLARGAPPGYPLQVRPRTFHHASGFSLISLPLEALGEVRPAAGFVIANDFNDSLLFL
jgi:hypothetical protein